MKDLTNELKNVKKIVGTLILAIVPSCITSFCNYKYSVSISAKINIILLVISYILSAIFIFYFDTVISKIKRYRKYKKYEGKWIEIIPGFSRNISICKLYFKHDGYHFDGTNYSNLKDKPVKFQSKKFVDNTKNDFFYITKNDHSINRFEGYGKVFGFSNSDRGFLEAQGYFFDVSSNEEQNLHHTFMIKFDKDFYDHHLSIRRDEDPSKFTDREIYEHVIDYVKENYKLEGSL